MDDEDYYEEESNDKTYIILIILKLSIILLFLVVLYKLKDADNMDNIDSKLNFSLNNNKDENSNNSPNITNTNIKNTNITNTNININITKNYIENKIDFDDSNLIKISKSNHTIFQHDYYIFSKVIYYNITNINYTFSQKYNLTKLEYDIGIYDKNKILNSPSNLTLHYDLKFICFIKIPNSNLTIYSLANNYEDKYINCKEYFKYGENITYGIKIYHNNNNLMIYFNSSNIIDYKNLSHSNDSLFEPLRIRMEYSKAVQEINNNTYNKSYYLKKDYFLPPKFELRRYNITKNSAWNFNHFYDDYFCFCGGENCFDDKIDQKCKYLFYMTIIDKYRNLYPKTEYVFADFIFNYLSFDDAYPIFQEMIRQNYPAHYLTENKKFIQKYCHSNEECESMIYVNAPKYANYGDTVEKYLTLILKTKAFITCRSTNYHMIGFLLYKTEYITYITIGHGICYFKDYLFSNGRIYGPDMNDKVLIPPSEPLISIAIKFGWKPENIIRINPPKWDKYNSTNKEIRENFVHNISDNSILIMFTYRMTKIAWNLNMSEYYFENITKLVFNDRLKKELEKNNLTLYLSLHRMVNPGYQKKYSQKFEQNGNIQFLPLSALSECLSKTNLVVTDFSSILFDLMYRNKPFIIYLPDGNDPLVNELYTNDYIELIKRMNRREWEITNICNNVEETVDKIIYYIRNKFIIDAELKKFFDFIGLKHEGSNIQKFIDYLVSL